MNRFKNYGTWISLIAAIGLILQVYGLFPKLGLTNETFNQVTNAVLGFLVAAGIISNPENGKGYLDEKKGDSNGQMQ